MCGTGSTRPWLAARDPVRHDPYEIRRCAGCTAGFTHPAPADMRPHYAGYYGARKPGRLGMEVARMRLRDVLQYRTGGPDPLLDVGCGNLDFLRESERRGFLPHGTEASGEATGAVDSRYRVAYTELAGAPFPRDWFGVITFWHSLEHLARPLEALVAARGLLRPGGAVVVEVPNADGFPLLLFGRRWFHLDVPRHLVHFTPRSLRSLLQRAGFRTVRVCAGDPVYDLFGNYQSVLNAMLRRENVVFDRLTGRGNRAGWWAAIALSPLAGALALLTWIISLDIRRPGILRVHAA